MLRIPKKTLELLTDPSQERNIYVHPNPIARDIFWQRLERVYTYLQQYTKPTARFLDFGGGSGVFNKACASYFNHIDVVDLDNTDALQLKQYFHLNNVHIITTDITSWIPESPYDVVVATDVLEHFSELSVPLTFLKNHITPGGYLIVSLPTENWIYELGRIVVNKTKPSDHYHTSAFVISQIKEYGFEEMKKSYIPQYIVPIPLFEIAVFQKPAL